MNIKGSSRKARVIDTMSTMGPSVLLGVAFTNLPGIICLHWAQMQIIEIFFFRMCFVMILIGIAHGLIFLPVILAYFGNLQLILFVKNLKTGVEKFLYPGFKLAVLKKAFFPGLKIPKNYFALLTVYSLTLRRRL